jgi:hypothetical protein
MVKRIDSTALPLIDISPDKRQSEIYHAYKPAFPIAFRGHLTIDTRVRELKSNPPYADEVTETSKLLWFHV